MHEGVADELGPERDEIDQPKVMPATRKIAILLFDEFEDGTLSASDVFSLMIFQLVLLRTVAPKDAIHDQVHQAVELADAAMAKGLVVHPRSQKITLLSTIEQSENSPDILTSLTELEIPDIVPDEFPDEVIKEDNNGAT